MSIRVSPSRSHKKTLVVEASVPKSSSHKKHSPTHKKHSPKKSPTHKKHSPKKSPTHKKHSPKKGSSPKRHIVKDCEREWVRSPITDRWIEVGGKTWNALLSTHKKELEAAPRKPTPGVMKNGICIPPVGDPPHDYDDYDHDEGEHRGWRGRRRYSPRRYGYDYDYDYGYSAPYYYPEPYYVAPSLTLTL